MFPLIWKCWFLRSGENRSTLYLKRNPSRARRKPTTNSTHIWRHRQDFCPGHNGESTAPPLLPIIENKWLSLLNHRSHSTPQRRLRRPATVPKPITFCKVTNKHQTIFFSVKTIARNLGKMYHSLNAGHLQLDESVRLNTLVIRCFFTSPTTVSKLLSPFYKKRGHKKRFFSHHHKFRAPTTSKTKAEARHHPSVLKVNFHHRLNVIYGRKFYATVEFHPKTLTRYDTIWYLDVNELNSESFN